MKTNKEIELRELFGNITYDMIAEQVAQATRQEVYKEVKAVLEDENLDIVEWLEEKQKVLK